MSAFSPTEETVPPLKSHFPAGWCHYSRLQKVTKVVFRQLGFFLRQMHMAY
uniref:Uncharacterized protein n=1 Tax=Lepeophtheirus salmonis TaxID=72036 RepID=A0A0K2VJV9_LEPSM